MPKIAPSERERTRLGPTTPSSRSGQWLSRWVGRSSDVVGISGSWTVVSVVASGRVCQWGRHVVWHREEV